MCTINFKTLSINKNNQKESPRSEERKREERESGGQSRAEREGEEGVPFCFVVTEIPQIYSTFLCCWLAGKRREEKNARRENGIKSERRDTEVLHTWRAWWLVGQNENFFSSPSLAIPLNSFESSREKYNEGNKSAALKHDFYDGNKERKRCESSLY